MRKLKVVLVSFAIAIGMIIIGFSLWAYTPASPMDEALNALVSTSKVTVERNQWLVFSPQGSTPKTGFIFYPGGRVNYRSYAPYARALAEEGYLVVIPRMPFNLAVFGYNRAEKILKMFPETQNWVIGGHSLGGAMAAHFLVEHPESIDGLVLVASYPAESDSLTNYGGFVTSISASLDGLAKVEDIAGSKLDLPISTAWVVVEGGNHAQFGWYGAQNGDNSPTISREEQQHILVESTLVLLRKVSQ